MKWYEIQYTVGGKKYMTVVRPSEIRPDQYHKDVLNIIECLVNAGAKVIGLREVVC